LSKLRKTKRQRLEEMIEWDEHNGGGNIPKQKLDWSMLGDQKESHLMALKKFQWKFV